MYSIFLVRLSRERITELQQQVEDLQKALQSQAAKPDDVSVPGPLAPIQRKYPPELLLFGCIDFILEWNYGRKSHLLLFSVKMLN